MRGCGLTWSDGHSGLHALSLSTTELEAIRIIPDHYIILVTRRGYFLVIDYSGFIAGLGIGQHGIIRTDVKTLISAIVTLTSTC